MAAGKATARLVDVDIHSGEFADHPYQVLNRLREESSVFWHERMQAFWVLGYEDVRAVVGDEDRFLPELPRQPQPHRVMLTVVNGEEHRRYRALATPSFALHALRTSVEPVLGLIVQELVDGFPNGGEIDLVEALANPIPARVMRHILQIPEMEIRSLMRDMEASLESLADPHNAELAVGATAANDRGVQAIADVVADEYATPKGGFLTRLRAAELDGQRLTEHEVVQFCTLLLVAGIETTQRLIANLVFALGRHPDQFDALVADRSLLMGAIEETLRYYPPNQFRMRFADVDTEVDGVAIPKGSLVYALTGAANRDPLVFERPDEFDIAREPLKNRHMSFGFGAHYCLGAHLARLETKVAAEHLLDRVVGLRLDPDRPARFVGFRNRSPASLWLLFDQRR